MAPRASISSPGFVPVLATGVAGFIGSHLGEPLVDSGESVVGIDSFTTYYDPAVKRQNIELKEGLSEQIAARTSLWPGAGPG